MRRARYFVLLGLAGFMWAAQGTAVKFLDGHLGPVAITFLPLWCATVLLTPLLIRERRRDPRIRRLRPRDWKPFVVAGIFGQVPAQLGMTWGITRSLASNGAILNLLIPVISAVFASFILRERITLLRCFSIAIGIAGVLLMSLNELRFVNFNLLAGNLLILAGCTGSAFYNVYCKGLLRRFTDIEILIYSYIVASLCSVPLLIWAEPFSFRSFLAFDAASWLAFTFLAVCVYGASMLLFFHALKHLDVVVASVSLYLVPVFGVALGITLLGEHLQAITILGAALVVGSAGLIMRYDRRAA